MNPVAVPFSPGRSTDARTAPERDVGRTRAATIVTACAAASIMLVGAAPAVALEQNAFRDVAQNLAAATHYKSVSPGESLGLLGFDLSIGLSATSVDDDAAFERASGGEHDDGDSLLQARLSAHKGLPFGIDIGAFVGSLPDQEMTLAGAELRFALVEGGVATPSVALRGSYSRVLDTKADGLDIEGSSAAVELSVSKGFLMFTPYAGAGIVYSDFEPSGFDTLDDESFEQGKLYLGVNVNLLTFNIAVEADRTGDHDTFTGKIGLRF